MDYNRALNSACIGWAIALIAIGLNVLGWQDTSAFAPPWNKTGIVAGVLALVAAYFGEGYVVAAHEAPAHTFRQSKCMMRARVLQIVSLALVAASYLFWFASQ